MNISVDFQASPFIYINNEPHVNIENICKSISYHIKQTKEKIMSETTKTSQKSTLNSADKVALRKRYKKRPKSYLPDHVSPQSGSYLNNTYSSRRY